MMRALFLRVAIGTCAAISLGASAANAQLVKPKYPGEIAAASEHIAQRNEDCRRQAREQHLHLVKLYRFMRDCKRRDRRNVLPRVADVGSGCTDARPDAQRNKLGANGFTFYACGRPTGFRPIESARRFRLHVTALVEYATP